MEETANTTENTFDSNPNMESSEGTKSAIWVVVLLVVLALLGYVLLANNDDVDTLPDDVTNPEEVQGEFQESDRVMDAEANAEANAELRPGLEKL